MYILISLYFNNFPYPTDSIKAEGHMPPQIFR